MPDITCCTNSACPLSFNCWRFNAPHSERQSIEKFEYDGDEGTEVWCKWYWPQDGEDFNNKSN